MRELARYLYDALLYCPGQTDSDLAQATGWRKRRLERCLCRMDQFGCLLWEDDHGRLYPFRLCGT